MKKIRVKKGEILSIVIMMVITSLVMVTATYAWFTISNTPKVNGLSMTAGTTGSLKIASESSVTPGTPGTYQDTLDFDANYFSTVKLSPVTTADGASFYAPQYLTDVLIFHVLFVSLCYIEKLVSIYLDIFLLEYMPEIS